MPDVIEPMPPIWISEEAKAAFEGMETLRMEIVRKFTIPPEVVGIITPRQVADLQCRMMEAQEQIVAQMCYLRAIGTVPRARLTRSCKCADIIHNPGCPEAPAG